MSKDTYHHGNLREKLLAVTAKLLAEDGLSKFSLREVARRSGVSHSAPGHHFGTANELLNQVAIQGFGLLYRNMQTAAAELSDPKERLIAAGKAYYKTAKENPGHFSVMMGPADGVEKVDDYSEASVEPFGFLVELVTAVIETSQSKTDPLQASFLCWSSVHGFVMLAEHIEEMSCGGSVDVALDAVLRTGVMGIVVGDCC